MSARGKGRRASRKETPEASVTIPRWLPPVLYGLATLLLFREFVFSDDMLYGSDTLSLGYMARKFYADAVAEWGVFPRWNPLILGGTPFLESLAGGDSLYPTSILLFVMRPFRALGWKLVIHVFLGGLFMAGWVRSLGRSRAAALLAGLAFSVAPFMVTLVHPGHDGKLFVTALTPLLFWAMEGTFRRRGPLPWIGVALVVALVILTTHFQLAYFLFGAAGLYYAFRCVLLWRRGGAGEGAGAGQTGEGDRDTGTPRRMRGRRALVRFGLFLAASTAGAAAAGVQLIPAYQYVTEFSRRTATTTRAGQEENRLYASSWSLHPEEAVSFVVPEFAGNAAGGADWATGSYWGRNFFKDNHEYAGLVVLLLALAGLLAGRGDPRRWFLAGLAVVAVLYALGTHTPVWGLFYALLPGVSLFRAPSMVSFLFGFGTITLAAYGVDRLLGLTAGGREDDGAGRVLPGLWIAAGVLALGTLLAASGALASLWTSVVWTDMDPGRLQAFRAHQPFIVRGFFVATGLAVAVAATAWAGRGGILRASGVVGVLGVLLFVDGFRVSSAFIDTWDFQAWSTPDPLVTELLDRQRTEPPFRVVDYDARQGAQSVDMARFGIEQANGHHPNDLARYRELIGMRGSGEAETLLHPNVTPLLNVVYIAVPGTIEGAPAVIQSQVGGQVYESLYRTEDLFGRPALARARLVADALVVPDDRAVETILDPTFDPATTAVLAEEPPVVLGGGPVEGGVEWVERGLNRQVLSVSADRPALLVLADNWFPAWRARVDGEAAPVMRAYHTLRAVPVPSGEHTVEVYYESTLLRVSLAISLITLAVLAGMALVWWLHRRRVQRGAAD